ncbi:membrane protein [Caldanaerobacter subterraneus subsp. yonseiensis KB-1]|uniref:Membrane protein n=1 Tax=Caldanaerobacter subterraneus subsp. yonseiensis KB-1 TaxID=1388761 RepID=U5CSA5_CALSX|nr:YIEGIA family protein [Caldanaerobacter subterraneus]ERM92828.1 membrane protein [Caldanaerobacter subterraneus subsp. yonseiensis KB-1]
MSIGHDLYIKIVLMGIVMGSLARFVYLRVDYRQYPTYPQGYMTHLTLGVISAALGAFSVPALIEKQYTAVTFLALAAQQFKGVREIERTSLEKMESTELVPRGAAYIENIAKIFEARNYIAMAVAAVTSLSVYLAKSALVGLAVGGISIYLSRYVMKTAYIRDIADVIPAKIVFKGPLLSVENVILADIGLKEGREIIEKYGVAAIIRPKSLDSLISINNLGIRQAILHETANQLGLRMNIDTPELAPMTINNSENGDVIVVMVVMRPDVDAFVEIIKNIPAIETVRKYPSKSRGATRNLG